MDNELSSPLSGEDYHGERWVDEREGKRAKQFDALSLLLLLSLSLSLSFSRRAGRNARNYYLVDTVIIVIVIVIASRNLIAARRSRRALIPFDD